MATQKRKLGVMTQEEYEANKNGVNIFFGAVMGIVIADAPNLSAIDYGLALTIGASMVVTLLYISASTRKIFFTLYAATMIISLWAIVQFSDLLPADIATWVINRPLPAFAVWFLFCITIEFAPRERE